MQSIVALLHDRATAPRLSWDDVALFLALCRSRTIGAAGKLLGVDASTVSRRLTALEEALGATLFERGRSGVTPSLVALELMPVAEEIEAAMARFATAAEKLEREVSGRVRITCPPDLAEVVMVPMLPELLARHPALRIELEAGEALADLTRREADIALRTVRPERGDLIVTRVLALRWRLAALPKLARSLGTLRSWNDAPFIGWGERLAHVPPARWLAEHVKETEPVVRSDSLRVQIALVHAGIGVALLPEPSFRHFGFVPVKVGTELRAAAARWPGDELYAVTHRALRDVPRVRTVWDYVLERLGKRSVARSG